MSVIFSGENGSLDKYHARGTCHDKRCRRKSSGFETFSAPCSRLGMKRLNFVFTIFSTLDSFKNSSCKQLGDDKWKSFIENPLLSRQCHRPKTKAQSRNLETRRLDFPILRPLLTPEFHNYGKNDLPGKDLGFWACCIINLAAASLPRIVFVVVAGNGKETFVRGGKEENTTLDNLLWAITFCNFLFFARSRNHCERRSISPPPHQHLFFFQHPYII